MRVRGGTTTTRAGRELRANTVSGRSGREGERWEGERLDDVLNERDDGVDAWDGARFACAAVMACAVMMSDGNAALADETSSLDAEVQALYAKTLDVEDRYERALEMNSEAVKALDDDKDNDEFESWNWQKLVNGKTGAGAPAPESKTKTKRVRKTPATAPKPTLVRKTPAAPPKMQTFTHEQSIKGRPVNVLDGLQLHREVLSPVEQRQLLAYAAQFWRNSAHFGAIL